MRVWLALGLLLGACAAPPKEPAPALSEPAPEPAQAPSAQPATPPDVKDASTDAAAALSPATPDAASAEAAWQERPFDDLTDAGRPRGRDVQVVIEVANQGPYRPLVLRIPETGLRREIYDDRVSRPGCYKQQRHDEKNAIFLDCGGIDGHVMLRAYQVGDELVIETQGRGDVRPTLDGRHAFALPKGRRVKLVTRVPDRVAPLPSTHSSGP
jgi:hypothetical protein